MKRLMLICGCLFLYACCSNPLVLEATPNKHKHPQDIRAVSSDNCSTDLYDYC